MWSLSDTEQASVAQTRAAVEQTKAATLSAYIDAGVLDPAEVRWSLAKEGALEIEEIITEADLDAGGELNLPEDALDIGQRPGPDKPKMEAQGDSSEAYTAAAVMIIKDGRVLCAKRRDGKGLCGPGGHAKPGETPEETALREAQEEFNIVPLSLIPLGVIRGTQGISTATRLFFTDRFTGTPKADGIEMTGERWISLDEARRERLHPGFEKSLEMLRDALRPFVSSRNHNNSVTPLDKRGNFGKIKSGTPQEDGGPGSGNFGHAGRPGKVGGSAPGNEGGATGGTASGGGGERKSGTGGSASSGESESGGAGSSASKGNSEFSTNPAPPVSARGKNAPCTGFANKQLFTHHVKHHLAEFPDMTDKQYEQHAIDFLTQPCSEVIDGYRTQSGEVVRFDRANGEYAKGVPGGRVVTCYIARFNKKTGVANLEAANRYFDRLKATEGVKENGGSS